MARGRRIALLAGVLALALVAVGGWWWRSSPDTFEDWGAGIGLPVRVDQAALVGTVRVPEGVVLHWAEPAELSGVADIDFLACWYDGVGGGIGAVRDSAAPYCTSVEPLAGVESDGNLQVVVQVVGSEPSEVVIEGIRLNYTDGWQRSTELLDFTIEVDIDRYGVNDW